MKKLRRSDASHRDEARSKLITVRASPGSAVSPINRQQRLTIMMLGLRGCPDVPGGVERHVEELAPRLVQLGCRVQVLARAPYVSATKVKVWRGVEVIPLASPRRRSLEAIVHTARGIVHAAWRRPDLLHIHAIGPAILAPMARLLGLRVVVTHHGYDYDRAKWGRGAKAMLRLGERFGMRFAAGRIAVSRSIATTMAGRYGVEIAAIPNGVARRAGISSTAALDAFGLRPGRYVINVARLVPEKRQLDLIAAFAKAAPHGWKLALVGGADHEDDYSRRVLAAAGASACVVATGFQSGAAIDELLTHAGLFVLPSSHEGLPIALLEALSFGVPAIASDIPGNREIGLPDDRYCPVGDIERLAATIASAIGAPQTQAERDAVKAHMASTFDWDVVASRTFGVYRQAIGWAEPKP